MELVSGFLLWLGDILGVRWIRKENNKFMKVVKAITFLLIGVILVVLYLVLFG